MPSDYAITDHVMDTCLTFFTIQNWLHPPKSAGLTVRFTTSSLFKAPGCNDLCCCRFPVTLIRGRKHSICWAAMSCCGSSRSLPSTDADGARSPPVHPFGVAGGGRSFFLSAFLGDPPSFVQVKGVLIVIGNFWLFRETQVTVSLAQFICYFWLWSWFLGVFLALMSVPLKSIVLPTYFLTSSLFFSILHKWCHNYIIGISYLEVIYSMLL